MFKNSQCRRILNYSISKNVFISKINSYHLSSRKKEHSIIKLLDNVGSCFDYSNKEWATSPYPIIDIPNSFENISKLKINPSDTSVILFPGQGMIKAGKVKQYIKYPRVKELFEIANEILGYDLLKICLKGPQNILDRTEFNQPATVVVSLAALEKLQEERPKIFESCVSVAGYSIGELTALIFSGALSYEEGLKLVAVRGTAMQEASEMSSQGMLFCYCLPSSNASQICKQAEKWAMNIGVSNPVCRYHLNNINFKFYFL
jgi:[acyl-carrier-protein] S-malonyltransferase